jgi:tetratricopeptide (TPR) repeat protein
MHAWLGGRVATPEAAGFAAEIAEAERLYAAGDNAKAAAAYRDALARAPKDWPGYARAVESQLFALQSTDGYRECLALAREAYPRLKGSASALNVAVSGLSCALELPAEDPGRAAAVAEFEARSREVMADPNLDVAGDDRSGLLATLVSSRQDAKDEAGSRKALEDWASFLEGEAATATTPERRSVYDSHRLSAYLELDQPERAVPMLQASERDFPDDYNPPARLAVALKAMKRYDEARAAADRALAKSYGPRKVRIYRTRAEIATAQADSAGAQRTLEEALAFAQALPAGQRSESAIAELKRLLGRAP